MNRKLRLAALAALLAFAPGCAARGNAGAPGFDTWIREELWLGAEIPTGGQVTDEAWAEFVTAEVMPRFSDGFSVVEAAGHWRHPDGTPVRERTRVLVILRPAGDAAAARALEAIAAAYVARFHQDAALHTADDVGVRFVEP